mmetsp:Transcript_17262/g.50146  ORF Transcript_17262/g.50146 Transcript_17262/m.50146 type:complete len:573 (-) Transcript_17262:270-1988(-)
MALHNVTSTRLEWGKMPAQIFASLPCPLEITAKEAPRRDPEEDATATKILPLNTVLSLRAIKATVALEENFANCALGKWKVTCESHYEFGFDEAVTATGNPSMFLQGGNDSNFGMVMTVLPSKDAGSAYEDESELERTDLEKFQPSRVTFYVRTDSATSDAGHFILGESNEVNRRVAQFQFTREGNMGLLGSGGQSFGAVPYEAHTWYRVDLTFNWERKEVDFYVNCKLEEPAVPFRRTSSNYIGACALGNRDQCTTWFESFSFIQEEDVKVHRTNLVDGRAFTWFPEIMREDELWLHAQVEHECEDRRSSAPSAGSAAETNEDRCKKANGAFVRWGPFCPVPAREVAQRNALNEAALADMLTMLDDEATADVHFNVEGTSMYAHACILAARCETFKAMLNSQLSEGRETVFKGKDGEALRPRRTIAVHEVRPPVFKKMLEYLYGGAIDVEPDMAIELLALADQYMLEGLKITCGFALRRSITVESVSRIIQAADRFDCTRSELKDQCLKFILKNYSQVVNSPMWEELAQSPMLLLQITRAIATAKKDGASSSGPSPPAHNTRKRSRGGDVH